MQQQPIHLNFDAKKREELVDGRTRISLDQVKLLVADLDALESMIVTINDVITQDPINIEPPDNIVCIVCGKPKHWHGQISVIRTDYCDSKRCPGYPQQPPAPIHPEKQLNSLNKMYHESMSQVQALRKTVEACNNFINWMTSDKKMLVDKKLLSQARHLDGLIRGTLSQNRHGMALQIKIQHLDQLYYHFIQFVYFGGLNSECTDEQLETQQDAVMAMVTEAKGLGMEQMLQQWKDAEVEGGDEKAQE